ncbi:2-oxoacid ferredoxin oxidoreductase [bacterium Unc6]|nr:2-oxoacid ferredoxin oxidoreductase [bacterium Unc6]
MEQKDFLSSDSPTWCPGCGNFGVLTALKKAIVNINKEPKDILLVSGIGQAAKLPHYIKCNCFNGLHGRALPVAVAAKIANHKLTVIVTTGDGDCYGEGGNHLLHNIRRNVDITVIVHNNQIYGLTKGQASPTTDIGYVTQFQPQGVFEEPLHPVSMAISLGCGFVARGYSADTKHLSWLIGEAIRYKGFSLVDVLQPCVVFNKKNTYQWYSEKAYKLEPSYDSSDKVLALQKADEWDNKIPLGIIYKKQKQTFEEKTGLYNLPPLIEQDIENIDITIALEEFK